MAPVALVVCRPICRPNFQGKCARLARKPRNAGYSVPRVMTETLKKTAARALANRRLQPLGHVSAKETQYIAGDALATNRELVTEWSRLLWITATRTLAAVASRLFQYGEMPRIHRQLRTERGAKLLP